MVGQFGKSCSFFLARGLAHTRKDFLYEAGVQQCFDAGMVPGPITLDLVVAAGVGRIYTYVNQGDRTFAEWTAEFSCAPEAEGDLVNGIGSDVFQVGFDALSLPAVGVLGQPGRP